MDQVKIGRFLKELRTEKELTQESLAEKLSVSNKTISRWETGNNMPDIGMLVEIADFYEVSIPEIINGERKSENMNDETRDTAVKMAEYSKNEVKKGKRKMISGLLIIFGLFVILSALAIFPNDSSWGSIYSFLGSIFLLIGVFCALKDKTNRILVRLAAVAGCALLLFGTFSLTDYLAVTKFNRVPRFCHRVSYNSENPNQLEYDTIFYTAVWENPGTEWERVYIK